MCSLELLWCSPEMLTLLCCSLELCWCSIELLWCSLELLWWTLELLWCSLELQWCLIEVLRCSLELHWCSLELCSSSECSSIDRSSIDSLPFEFCVQAKDPDRCGYLWSQETTPACGPVKEIRIDWLFTLHGVYCTQSSYIKISWWFYNHTKLGWMCRNSNIFLLCD